MGGSGIEADAPQDNEERSLPFGLGSYSEALKPARLRLAQLKDSSTGLEERKTFC